MTNDNTPLTAIEKYLSKLLKELPNIHVTDLDVEALRSVQAAQQTAAKDARIAELDHLLAVRMSNAARKIEDIKQAHRCRNEDVSMKLYNTEAERDALKAKLDDAQAQVAMLVEKLAILIDEITDNGSYPYDTPKEITVHNSMGAVLNTQNAAEQWKANLLKPWREAVTVLRGALRLAYRELNEIWARTGAPCDGLGTKMVDEDYFEEVIKDVRKALKATEELTDD